DDVLHDVSLLQRVRVSEDGLRQRPGVGAIADHSVADRPGFPVEPSLGALSRQMTSGSITSSAERILPYVDATLPRAGTRRRWQADKILLYVGLLCICAGFAMPFLWMLSTSLKTLENSTAFPPQIIPHPIQPQNYWTVLNHPKLDFPLFTRNTLIIAGLS